MYTVWAGKSHKYKELATVGIILEALARHLSSNRRRAHRQRRKYDTIIRDESWREVFRGRTVDVSQTGAKLAGFPARTGVHEGQNVTLEFLLVPKNVDQIARRVPVHSEVVRVEERADDYIVAVRFDKALT